MRRADDVYIILNCRFVAQASPAPKLHLSISDVARAAASRAARSASAALRCASAAAATASAAVLFASVHCSRAPDASASSCLVRSAGHGHVSWLLLMTPC